MDFLMILIAGLAVFILARGAILWRKNGALAAINRNKKGLFNGRKDGALAMDEAFCGGVSKVAGHTNIGLEAMHNDPFK